MADKNKKGIEIKEYPKLVRVGDKKVLVNSKEEEAKIKPSSLPSKVENGPKTEIDTTQPVIHSAGWGKN